MLYFDIGANVGKWCLANINKCDKIIAVEASEKIFKTLKENFKNNDNIICLNYAVCNQDNSTVKFYEYGCVSTINKNWLCKETSRFYKTPYTLTTAKTIKLDTLIEQYGKPDLIKIDVEGAEHRAIASLNQKIDTICFEWAQEFPLVTQYSIEHLLKIGFKKFYVQFNGSLFFQPKDEDYTEDLKIVEEKLKEKRTEIRKTDGMIVEAWGMIWAK